jgi:MFS family permease
MTIGGHGALIVAGAVGPAGGAAVDRRRHSRCQRRRSQGTDGVKAPQQSVITPAIIVLTIFFMLLSLSNAGIGNFGVVALMSGYGVTFSAANIALTAFLGASAAGVLAGGFLADRTRRHGQVAAACFALNAAIVLVIATSIAVAAADAAMAMAGFLGGVIAPSRDMLVRNAAPAGAAGRAFGIVSTGFNFGGIVSPLLFGWIMDQNMPHWVFGASAVFMVLTVLLALVTDRKPAKAQPESATQGLCIPEPHPAAVDSIGENP